MTNNKEKEDFTIVKKENLDALADNIQLIANSMKIIDQSSIKRDTIIELIRIKTKLSKRDITLVLNSLNKLDKDHLK